MTALLRLPQHEARLRQARARAEFELGDPDWANKIIVAYCNPDNDAWDLERDKLKVPE